MKKLKVSVALSGGGGLAVMWPAKVVVQPHLGGGRGGEKIEVALVQYMEVTAPLNPLEKNKG